MMAWILFLIQMSLNVEGIEFRFSITTSNASSAELRCEEEGGFMANTTEAKLIFTQCRVPENDTWVQIDEKRVIFQTDKYGCYNITNLFEYQAKSRAVFKANKGNQLLTKDSCSLWCYVAFQNVNYFIIGISPRRHCNCFSSSIKIDDVFVKTDDKWCSIYKRINFLFYWIQVKHIQLRLGLLNRNGALNTDISDSETHPLFCLYDTPSTEVPTACRKGFYYYNQTFCGTTSTIPECRRHKTSGETEIVLSEGITIGAETSSSTAEQDFLHLNDLMGYAFLITGILIIGSAMMAFLILKKLKRSHELRDLCHGVGHRVEDEINLQMGPLPRDTDNTQNCTSKSGL